VREIVEFGDDERLWRLRPRSRVKRKEKEDVE
jgi:hypothetical protein